MKRGFKSESDRKVKFFNGLIEYLRATHAELDPDDFEDVIKGVAFVTDVSPNRFDLTFENGLRVRHIPIPPEVSEFTCPADNMLVVVGRYGSLWRLIDVIYLGSSLGSNKEDMHLTFNPVWAGEFKDDRLH